MSTYIHRAFATLPLLLFMLLPAAAAAQDHDGSITGVILDESTGQPLAGALVVLLEGHRQELSRQDGTFAFTRLHPGDYTVLVNLIGYATHREAVTVQPGEDLRVEIRLPVAVLRLSGIVVTGAVSQREGRDVLSPVSVVTGRELDRRLDGTVAGTIRDEPGIALASLGPAPSRPVIRGLGGDRILMLEDGQRPGDMSSLSPDHAVAIDPLTARQIEVVRGPMSLLYGSSALGGVVNVIRDEIPDERDDHVHGTATLQASSVNSGITGGGVMYFPAGPLALRAEASARTSGDIATPVGDLVNTGASVINTALGGAWVNHVGHVGASYRFYSNDYGIPGGFVGGHDHGVDVDMRRHTIKAAGEWHPEDGRIGSIRATGTFNDYSHAEIDDEGHDDTSFEQTLASLETTANLAPTGALQNAAFGVRGQYRDIRTGGELRTPSTWDMNFAAFAVAELGTGPLRFQVGARYDIADYNPRDTTATITAGGEEIRVRPRTFSSVSGAAGVLWIASDALRFGASVSRAHRTPDFNELYSNGPHLAANSYDVGDTELDEETGIGFDVFTRFQTDRLTFDIAAFHNTLNSYIFPSSRGRAELGGHDHEEVEEEHEHEHGGERPRFQYTNEDARFYGFEGELQVAILPELILDATASHVLAEFTSDRAPIPVITPTDTTFVPASEHPPLIPPLHGSVGLRYERPSWFLGAGTRWAARQNRTGDFEEPTPGYAIGELTAGYRIAAGGRIHAITLRVDNLFDREYRDHLSRIKDIMPEPGRGIHLTYRLSF